MIIGLIWEPAESVQCSSWRMASLHPSRNKTENYKRVTPKVAMRSDFVHRTRVSWLAAQN
jgi:hypothetical protein